MNRLEIIKNSHEETYWGRQINIYMMNLYMDKLHRDINWGFIEGTNKSWCLWETT